MPSRETHQAASDLALAAALTDLARALRSTHRALDDAIHRANREPRVSVDDIPEDGEPVVMSRDWMRSR
jgi:hypothetical protein